ncbi:hypothetical protein C0708_22515 [Aeromonas caviae]|nr:hypothetical protein C0708_22515 [Aeromonas caviae]
MARALRCSAASDCRDAQRWPERGSAGDGSPSEVKVTAQVTDQAGNPSGIADDTAKVDNVRPRRRAWNCKAPVPTTPTTRQRLVTITRDRQGDAECGTR